MLDKAFNAARGFGRATFAALGSFAFSHRKNLPGYEPGKNLRANSPRAALHRAAYAPFLPDERTEAEPKRGSAQGRGGHAKPVGNLPDPRPTFARNGQGPQIALWNRKVGIDGIQPLQRHNLVAG